MIKKEKELEELYKIIKDFTHKDNQDFAMKVLAQAIIDEGYTKSSFSIEKLKAWLKEIEKDYEKYNFGNIKMFNKNPIQVVLDKIQELEEESQLAKEGR